MSSGVVGKLSDASGIGEESSVSGMSGGGVDGRELAAEIVTSGS